MKAIFALAAAILLAGAAAGGGPALRGVFALQGAVAKTSAYLVADRAGADPLAQRFDLWMTPLGSGAAISSYETDMTKLVHVLIVSDDFSVFIHDHPEIAPGGHFVFEQRLPKLGLYHVYADGRPEGDGQQVFRFDLQAGAPAASTAPPRDLGERSATCLVDGYAVTLSTLALKAGSESTIEVHIRRDGRPATDLHPYLTALAHAVFINAEDLTYVHVHPLPLGAGHEMAGMEGMQGMHGMESMASPAPGATIAPDMALHVSVLEPGTYKLWFQFAGGSAVHVAQFALTAEKELH